VKVRPPKRFHHRLLFRLCLLPYRILRFHLLLLLLLGLLLLLIILKPFKVCRCLIHHRISFVADLQHPTPAAFTVVIVAPSGCLDGCCGTSAENAAISHSEEDAAVQVPFGCRRREAPPVLFISGHVKLRMTVAAAVNSDRKNAELLRLRELYQNLTVGGRVCAERTEAGNVQHVWARCGRDGEDGDAFASQARSQKR